MNGSIGDHGRPASLRAVHTHQESRFPACVRPVAPKTVNLPTTPAAAVAALANKVRLALLVLAAAALPACSSSSDATPVTTSGMVQNLTLDPAGQTIVTTLEGFDGTITPASVEASGAQTAVTVAVTGSTFSIAFDGVVSPDHQVRFVGVAGISDEWRDVTSTDSRNPAFTILGATQDTSDTTLGGDTVSVQFYSGPRVLESSAEDISNWTLSVDGTTLDLAGSTIALDNATQIATFTLGRFANLHASFTLSCDVETVAATSVGSNALTGTATGDTAAPTVASVTQDLDPLTQGDEFGRVLVFDFNEPVSPVFGALPSNFTVVDHVNAQGVTMPTSVEFEAGDDTQLRVTFSRPVVPGLDQIALAGVVDAHGNPLAPITSAIAAGSVPVNAFTTVTFETVEGVANDRVLASTSQALDPDTAANFDRWTLTVGGVGLVDLSTQTLSYDLLSRTLTIDLDFDVANGTTGDLAASGAVDVDGETFSLPAPQATAAGDDDTPGVSSLTQNRVADLSGKTVDVVFTEDIDPTTATNTANYTFTPALTVDSATVVAGNIVRLQTDDVALPGDYTLTVAQAVSDPAGNDLGAPFGPTAFPSTDVVAPTSIAASGTAVEGAENDQVAVLFDDDMFPADVEDVSNWTLESPVGNPIDLTGSSVSYSTSGGVATLVLDAPGAAALIRSFDAQVSFTGVRDLGGNAIGPDAIATTVVGESNRPALESTFIVASGAGDELTLRFSEPMRRLTDLYDAVGNPAGVRYTLTDASTGTPLAPLSATEIAGGLGVTLTFGAVIDPLSTIDVVGLVDLAGNVLFPVLGASFQTEVTDTPAIASVQFNAVEGAGNDQVVATFNHPMSAWGITDPSSYSCADSFANPVSLAGADFSFDGNDTVTITFTAGSAVNLSSTETYELTLEVAAERPLRTQFGVALTVPDAGPSVAVSGDTVAGPTAVGSQALIDPSSTENAFVIFSESVDATAGATAANYVYNGTAATTAVLVDPRVVQLTFSGVTVTPGFDIDVNAAVVDTAGNASAGPVLLSVTSDLSEPTVVSSTSVITPGFGGDYIDVLFDEPLDPAIATISTNYVVSSGADELRLLGVIYDSGTNTVRLLVDDMLEGASVVTTMENLADFAGNALAGPTASAAVAGGDSVIPAISAGVNNLWWDAAGTTVDVEFTEGIDYAYAATVGNWTTSGTATVTAADAIGVDHVRLTLSEALGAGETVILNAGLTDPAGNAAGTLAIAPAN